MRYLTEYFLAFLTMVIAIFVTVKPGTKDHWSLSAKVAFYCLAAALFLALAMFEYFVGKSISDMVREAIGNSFCETFTIDSCPSAVKAKVAQREAEGRPRDA